MGSSSPPSGRAAGSGAHARLPSTPSMHRLGTRVPGFEMAVVERPAAVGYARSTLKVDRVQGTTLGGPARGRSAEHRNLE